MPRILSLYIFKECSTFFLLTFTIITVTAMLSKIVSAVELATSASLGGWFVVELVASSLPYSISYTIPASFMASIIIVFTRLSTDNELTAIKSTGISLTSMLKPTMTLALIVFALSLFSNIYLYPRGNAHIKELMFEAVKTKLTAGIEEKRFYDQFRDTVLYIEKINDGLKNTGSDKETLEGIFISEYKEGKDPVVIFANYGTLESDAQTLSLALNLFDGVIYKQDLSKDEKRTHKLRFETYRIDLTMEQHFFGKKRSFNTKNLTIRQVYKKIAIYKKQGFATSKLYIEAYKRIAQPFSIFAFVLLAIPLGIQKVRAPKFTGGVTALTLILFFQIFTRLFKTAGESESISPFLAAFGPTIIFLLAGIFVFYLATKEKHIEIGSYLETLTNKIKSLLWGQK